MPEVNVGYGYAAKQKQGCEQKGEVKRQTTFSGPCEAQIRIAISLND